MSGTSGSGPAGVAFAELERLVRSLGEELAFLDRKSVV